MSTSPGRGGLLPAIRSRFTAAHPEATARLRQVSWEDPTAGLADGSADVAFVWLPLPDEERYAWTVLAEEPRLVALPDTHPLAARAEIDFTDLLDEPFLALPRTAGRCATTGSPWTPGRAARRASAPRSPGWRRRTRRWSPASASACSPRATPR
ncbi:LysR substrate-binding domain-containing protein [Streptomyces diastatochromogenes]|nr:LysR substrate-binding domain-containing protein [Streptomyces diastatochromogenes]